MSLPSFYLSSSPLIPLLTMLALLITTTVAGLIASKSEKKISTILFWTTMGLFLVSISYILFFYVRPWTAMIPFLPVLLFLMILFKVKRS